MNIYENGVISKVRFATAQGSLTMEQLSELKKTKLAAVVRDMKKDLNESSNDDDLSFLDENAKPVDKMAQLRFDIAKDMYIKLVEREKAASNALANREFNKQIDQDIADRVREDRKKLSVEELLALKK